jgi:hypothetical protein
MALCAALAPTAATAQTPPAPAPDPSLPAVTVTATQLDEARGSIQPSLGASRYDFTRGVIEAVPLGEQAPINQVILRAPAWRRTASASFMCAATTATCSTGWTACSCPRAWPCSPTR